MVYEFKATIRIDDEMQEYGYGKPSSLVIGIVGLDDQRKGAEVTLRSFNGTDVENISPDLIELETWRLQEPR